jgi:hypothetical protein
MLSIQYVYERVFLFQFAPELSFSKRLQKYNFFLNSQAFLKIYFLLFFPYFIKDKPASRLKFFNLQ